MRRPNTFVRVAAVASSVLLVGGLLCYRAGAFGWTTTPVTPTTKPVPADTPPTGIPSTLTPAEYDRVLMSGSKTIAISPIVPAPSQAPAQTPTQRTIMPGSKSSFSPMFPPISQPPTNAPNSPPPASPPK